MFGFRSTRSTAALEWSRNPSSSCRLNRRIAPLLALDQPMPYLVEAWAVGALGATFRRVDRSLTGMPRNRR
jgi:hypothetical protein